MLELPNDKHQNETITLINKHQSYYPLEHDLSPVK